MFAAPIFAAMNGSAACVLVAGMQRAGDAGEVHRLAVGPDAADAGDRALAERDGERGEVEVLGGLDAAASAAALAATAWRVVSVSSRKSVAQMMLPPTRMRP